MLDRETCGHEEETLCNIGCNGNFGIRKGQRESGLKVVTDNLEWIGPRHKFFGIVSGKGYNYP